MTRRRSLFAVLAGLSGCAARVEPTDRIIEVASGRELTRAELLTVLRHADHVLLGEQHDNPHHHQRRGALITQLGPDVAVVAEHMPRGARVAAGRGDVHRRLVEAGFDARAWGWPLYQPLFEPVLLAGLPLLGGNAPAALARQIAREGPAAWPPELRVPLQEAPLDATARTALDAGLVAGHCGHLPASRLPAMRAAQRARDASMALAMLTSDGRPAVLLAGNGHVGTDHGVPQLLRHMAPQARLVSVGFGEPDWTVQGEPYTYVWITPGVSRKDPCAGIRMLPAPPAAAASSPWI